jgi:hypothetical protein
MTEPEYVLGPSADQIWAAEDAYHLAVGRLSYAWNHLHRVLGGMFAVVVAGDREPVFAAWRSVENDRAQRGMLWAAIEAASPERWKKTPKAPDDLRWVLERARKLSDVRNDAIHALVALYAGGGTAEMKVALPVRGKLEKKLLDRGRKQRPLRVQQGAAPRRASGARGGDDPAQGSSTMNEIDIERAVARGTARAIDDTVGGFFTAYLTILVLGQRW